jgi:hypothetical protein
MANQVIGLGTVENDGTGDNLRVALDKVNDNFLEIYTLIGDASSLTSGISATATVVTLTAPTISGVVGGTITSATITTLTGTTFNAGTLALSAGSITDSSGAISFGNENLTTTGVVTAASLDISGNVDVDGTLETDALTIDGVSLSETIADTIGAMVSSNTETNITVTYDDADNTLDFVIGTLNQSTSGNAGTATALETARTIHGVSFDGTANIDLSEVVQDTVGAMFSNNTETNITATYQDADGTIDLIIGTLNQDTTGNAATATSLETARTIGGVSFDGSANINLPGVNSAGNQNTSGSAATLTTARTIGGTSFDGSANIDVALATLATTVTITDNESTDENNAIIFTAGGEIDGGNLGLESDGTLTYNPSTGKVTATGFVGTLTGNVTGNTSGTAATVTGAAQTNITSVGTLTALQVDNINIDGNAITSTAGVDLTITPLAGQQIVLDGTIVIDAGVVTGATSITSTAFVGDITGDVTGTADVATVATTVTITDNESTDENNAIIFTAGGDVDGGNLGLESDGTLTYNPSTGKVTATGFVGTLTGAVTGNADTATVLATARTIGGVSFNGSANINLPGVNTAGNQNTSGSAATLTTARTIGGVSFNGSANIDLPGVNTAGNQNTSGSAATLTTARTIGGTSFDGSANIDVALATLATTVTITDNESTDENNALIFTAGGDIDGGNLGLESDGTLTYNPSTGKVTATGFVGTLTGNVTGDVTGNADTATALATARTIGGVSFDGSANINLPGVNSAGNQNTSGSAATLTTARTIGGTSFDGSANIDVALATLATTATVSDSNANTNFPVVFNDESNALLDDTGALRYNPSTGTLLVPNLVVAGTTTQVDTVTMEAANAIVFEGATADIHETTLTIIDPTADRTQRLINQSGYIPLLAALTTTAITSTPEELNILDGATVVVGEINALDLGSTAVGNAIASKAVILDSSKDYTGIRNLTISGEIDAATGDYSGAVDIAGATTTAAITASGIIKTDDTTAATSTTDGSLQTDGGLSVAADAVIGDDLFMLSDAAVITFGADKDVTLTHVADTGLLLNGTSVIQFNDASQNIGAPSATVLDINATDEIELNATLLDVNANINASGTYTGAGTMTTGGNIVIPNAGNIGSVGDTDSIAIASNGVVTFSQAPVFPDGSIAIADLDIDGATDIGAALVDADLIIVDDGAGGTNRKSTLARLKTYMSAGSSVAADDIAGGDAAVLITTSSGNITIDAAADDSDIIIKGTDGTVDTTYLTIDGSAAGAAAFNSTVTATGFIIGSASIVEAELELLDGLTAGTAIASKVVTTDSSKDTTGQRNLTISGEIDAATGDFSGAVDIAGATTTAAITASGIIKTDDTTAATSTTDGSLQTDGGLSVTLDAVIGDDLILLSDAAVIHFGADSDVTLTHVADTGILLNGTSVIQFNDASQNIGAPSATVLDINATDEIELNATLVDVNANLDVSGTYTGAGTMTTGGNIIIPNAGNIGSVGDTDSIAIASNGVVTFSQIPVMPANSIDSDEYIDGSIDREHLAADIIDGTKIADDAIDSEHYTDGSIDLAHMSANSVDSDQYVDGSIDTVHIADNQITLAKMAGIARGKIIYGDASGDPAVLTAGSNTQVLTSDGTDISWADAAGGASAIDDLSDALTNSSGATIGIGTGALAADDGSANNNTALGYQALNDATTAAFNVAVGYQAMDSMTTGFGYSTAVGYQALGGATTGYGNTALGHTALSGVITGNNNTAIGRGAGSSVTGSSCVIIGHDAGRLAGTGSVAIGADSLTSLSLATSAVAVGLNTLKALTSGANNTAVGQDGLVNATTGANNTALGNLAGNTLTTGTNNTLLGYDAEGSSATVSNEITLGNASVTKFRIPGINFVIKTLLQQKIMY